MNEETKKKKTTSTKKTTTTKKAVAKEPKTTTSTTKKTSTKKASAKKTTTKKPTAENKDKTVKTATNSKTTSKKSSAQKKETPAKKTSAAKTTSTKKTTKTNVKKEKVNIEIPVQEDVKKVEIKEQEITKPIIEIKKEVVEENTEEYVVKNIKKDDQIEIKTPNYKVIILLLLLIIFLFICGVIYIMDYSKKIGSNKKTNRENVTYTLDDFAEKVDNSTEEPIVYENIEKITVYEYEKKLKKNEKMIVLVASKYCGGCKIYEPVLNAALKEKNLKAYKIDVAEFESDEEKELFDSLLKITGTPTTFLIENGKAVASISSSTDKETVITWLDTNYEVK